MGILDALRWETRLQARGLRFRLGVPLYLVLSSLPALTLFLALRRDPTLQYTAQDFLVGTLFVQGLFTTVLSLLLVGSRCGPQARAELSMVLCSAALSNTGYQLRRWAALVVLVLGLALVPVAVAAGFATFAGVPPQEPARWLTLFVFYVATPAVFAVGGWLGLVALGGGELMAVFLLFLFVKVGELLFAKVSTLVGWRFPLSLDLFGTERFGWVSFLIRNAARQLEGRSSYPIVLSADAFDARLALAQWWPEIAPVAGLAAALALVSPLWLRRSRRDVKPLVLRDDHPLRSTLPRLYGLFLRIVPDAGLRYAWIAVGAAITLLGVTLGALYVRGETFLELAERRYAAESAGGELPVTRAGLRISEWRTEGILEDDGSGAVDLRWRIRVEADEDGDEDGKKDGPEWDHLAFELDPFLEISELAIDRDDGRRATAAGLPEPTLHPRRQWNRWIVGVEPPLRRGESLTLSARVRGAPRTVDWPLPTNFNDPASFVVLFQRFLRSRSSPMAQSSFRPALSSHRIHLAPGMLGPVPRYTTWALTPPPATQEERGSEVPKEEERVPARVELDLAIASARPGEPGSPLLASSCGGLSSSGHLVESCLLPPDRLEVLGGPFAVVEAEAPVALASLPAHRQLLSDLAPSFVELVSASRRAWPGHPGVERLVVVEWPGEFSLDQLLQALSGGRWQLPRVSGRLIVLPEEYVSREGVDPDAYPEELDLEPLLGEMLAVDLFARRGVAEEDLRALRAFFGALMMRRMDAGRPSATIGGSPWVLAAHRQPIRSFYPWSAPYILYGKIPALMVELEERLGLDVLVAAMEEFLARGDDPAAPPGTFDELFALLAEHGAERPGAATLDAFYHRYWHEGGLPVLRLESVDALPVRGGWRVVGRVENSADGESWCPLVVSTEGAAVRSSIAISSQESREFEIFVEHRPHTVLLDPDGRCVRQARSPRDPSTRADLSVR